ncbi:GNAT superfamily N-acetyltransferase [Nocardioides sp. BE266]|uniref:GNAT family N-acetyltransferase n=1 Tax=Nocardioides sp. BE266 TaxID=2817725 RepID=UPI0028673CD3|nr:GNAT family N-acetyltransferase [Nocardioides sp. BE266]MDR7251386.1 GNAT superfamily N-acetyltransferase [Nocardioides sp. BE266]
MNNHVHVTVRLADGGSVLLRPLTGGEVSVLETVFDGLSPQSRHQRFLVPMPRLPGAHRRSLADVDGHRHVAWVALVDGVPVGIARYIRTELHTAELAFEVADAHQGRGIGSALVDAVTTVARDHGIRYLEATVEPGNRASEALLSRVGIRLRMSDGLLEGRGEPRVAPSGSPVNRRAVLALAGQLARSSSTAAATSSSWRSEPCLATS